LNLRLNSYLLLNYVSNLYYKFDHSHANILNENNYFQFIDEFLSKIQYLMLFWVLFIIYCMQLNNIFIKKWAFKFILISINNLNKYKLNWYPILFNKSY
jgi:flagellar biosynthesis protein FlhB